MNSSSFLRYLTTTTNKILTHNGPLCRPQIGKLARMSTNVSISQAKKERDNFLDVLPSITESLVRSPKFSEVPEVGTWLKRVLEYNLSGGKKARGLTTVFAYEMLEKPENVTEESLRLARIMGWCVEMLQAYLLVLDDMMDGSTTRRGLPCWYRLPDVGLGAINDSILIYMSIYNTLKTNFGDRPYYTDILEVFNESLLNTSIGQHLDYTMAHRNTNDYSLFTIDRYSAIVKFKTAYYTYKLPVSLGLYLAGKTNAELHKIAEDIFLELGQFFQSQDDYIDCFGDESVTGKMGTDIQEGKCTWLAVTALQLCDSKQRAEFEECYGSKDLADVQRIKRLYETLGLREIYRAHEKAAYERIVQRAHSLPTTESGDSVSPALVLKLLDMIYNRKN
ncbi:hypothetical protein ABMA27_006058 [Loxostege sticticalis]|uniref:Farnesyl pyrophosphate synthase n=1 Tax=Loxostege sticticalis TaxID=481309 RepID=A0ABR3HHG4_LOXSC